MPRTSKIDQYLTVGLLWIMLICVWTIWTPIGFFFWIPLLFRTTLVFAGLVIHAVITEQSSRELRSHLEAAIGFWFAGFRIAYDSIFRPSAKAPAVVKHQGYRILLEILWSSTIWVIGTLLFAPSSFNVISEVIDGRVQGVQQAWLFLGLTLSISFLLLGMLLENWRTKHHANIGRSSASSQTPSELVTRAFAPSGEK